jgi:hypothetical protein
MDWLGDLIIPTYVAALGLLGATVRGVWRLIQRLTKVEAGIDRLEIKVDHLSEDLRSHMAEEGKNIDKLIGLIRSTQTPDS